MTDKLSDMERFSTLVVIRNATQTRVRYHCAPIGTNVTGAGCMVGSGGSPAPGWDVTHDAFGEQPAVSETLERAPTVWPRHLAPRYTGLAQAPGGMVCDAVKLETAQAHHQQKK